jgi:hypothetical protein
MKIKIQAEDGRKLVLGMIYGNTAEEVTGEWIILHVERLVQFAK